MNTIKRLYRNTNDKVIGGIASGLGEYFNIDPVIIRILLVIGAIAPIPFFFSLCYIVMWIIMPAKPITTYTIPVNDGNI